MTITRHDLLNAISVNFCNCEPEAILAELDNYGLQSHEQEKERVQLAIIELCGGNRDKLVELIAIAKTDYRDILAWRQLGPIPAPEGDALQEKARALIEKWGKG
jgi:hypothetical protein